MKVQGKKGSLFSNSLFVCVLRYDHSGGLCATVLEYGSSCGRHPGHRLSLKIGQHLQEDAGQVLFSAFFPPKLRTPWRRPYQGSAPYMPQFPNGIPYNELPLRRPGAFVLDISREKHRRTRLYSFLRLGIHSSLAIRVMNKFFHPKDTAYMSQLMRTPQLLFCMANLLLLPLLLPSSSPSSLPLPPEGQTLEYSPGTQVAQEHASGEQPQILHYAQSPSAALP